MLNELITLFEYIKLYQFLKNIEVDQSVLRNDWEKIEMIAGK